MMRTSRDDLMDYIDDTYNNYENHQYLENTYRELFGELDDSGPEGMFTGLTTYQLQQLADALDGKFMTTPSPQSQDVFAFTDDELSVLIVAMENFSDVTWTKDREMSRIAKRILRKLTQ